MAETKHVADYTRMVVYMASAGTAGDIVYNTTGSGLPGGNTDTFLGVLDTNTVAGSYGVVETRGVFNLTKGDGTGEKIEQGQEVYGSGAAAIATAQVSTGCVIGLAWAQSSSDTGSVSVMIQGMNHILM